jgi:hypothetical protein
MQHSEPYVPFLETVLPLLGTGPPGLSIPHLEIKDPEAVLVAALTSPVTQISILHLGMNKVAGYFKWWKEEAMDRLAPVSQNLKALWTGYAYEDPYSRILESC